jgi:hypothetical protein
LIKSLNIDNNEAFSLSLMVAYIKYIGLSNKMFKWKKKEKQHNSRDKATNVMNRGD